MPNQANIRESLGIAVNPAQADFLRKEAASKGTTISEILRGYIDAARGVSHKEEYAVPSLPQEKWNPVLDYEGRYEVSNFGRVKACTKVTAAGHVRSERILNPCVNASGYLSLILTKNGRQRSREVHRLVLETFRGARPEGMECCHNDGVKTNNRLDNLRWDTRSSNQRDKRQHGAIPDFRGEKHPNAKLTAKEVRRIRKLAQQGHTQTSIAKKFGITKSAVCGIIARRTWKHLS
jgi:hypothetical protein